MLQRVRPDVVLLNEFDYDVQGRAADLFERDYLGRPQHGGAPIDYPFRYFAEVNTGVASGMDITFGAPTQPPQRIAAARP